VRASTCARQFGLQQCREAWVLWIDADEQPDERMVAALARLATPAAVPEAGFSLERRTYFLGRPIRFCGWRGETVLRVFRREQARFDDAPVHERVLVEGPVGRLDAALEHHSYADWDDCVGKLVRYARAGAEKARGAARRAAASAAALRSHVRPAARVPRRLPRPAAVRARSDAGLPEVR
jgi:hypothetical protein